MNCLRCNTSNEEGAKFCKNCGMDLTYLPATKDENTIKSITYILIVMSFEYFSWLIWFAIQKVIVPQFYQKDGSTDWDAANKLYKTIGWSVDILSILVLIIFTMLIKNKTARIFLIIFALVRIGLLLGYRVFVQ
jgi:hypothetical protein